MIRRTAFSKLAFSKFATRSTIALSLGSVLLGAMAMPSLAGDPFGRGKPIGKETEDAFNALFKEGNYKEAKKLLEKAKITNADEPLVHALNASLLFGSSRGADTDKAEIKGFLEAAQTTQATAKKLMASDAGRGNLYMAVGHFLESAHIIADKGIVGGTPDALGKLTTAFQHLGEAEKINPNDPEYNLLKGAMDLLLAVNINLPLSDANAAIDRVKQAKPTYISNRVLAWGYRDMGKLDDALKSVDAALAETPQNPEIHYLKGQILFKNKKVAESVSSFTKALEKSEQLTPALTAQFCNDLWVTGDRNAYKTMSDAKKCGPRG